MEQGFSAYQELSSASTNAASRAASEAQATIAKAMRSGHAPAQPHNPNATLSAAEVTAKGAALYGNAAKGERAAEENLRGVQSKLMLPAMLSFVAMPVMWIAKKLPLERTKTVIGSVFSSSVRALNKTKITDIVDLPANYMKAVAGQAKMAGADEWAKSALETSKSLRVTGEAVQGKVAQFAQPVTNAISGAFEKFSQTGFAKAIPDFIKNNAGKVRGASVFQVMMIAGTAAGIAATMIGSRAEKKETKVAFDNLMADMGGDVNSPFAKAVKATYKTKNKAGLAKTGLELASGVVEGVMWAAPGVGGLKMMGAMMVPQLCQSLVPECPTLGAHAALTKADAGELKIDAAARTDLWKQLIAISPNVAANGGMYNRLTTPIAKEFVARGLTAKQGAQLLNDEKAFTALASEIFAKQQAAKPAVAAGKAEAANDAHVGREPVKAVAKEMTVAISPQAANAPKLQVSGAKMHHGTVAANQLQVG
jgi:hypothetical protein